MNKVIKNPSCRIWKVDIVNNKENYKDILQEAVKSLVNDQIVAFPTETVYGLGGNALSNIAIEKIFKAKGRPPDNPLIVHVHSIEQVNEYVKYIHPIAKKLMEKFWPGPLTILFPTNGRIVPLVTCNLSTVAIRMPNHPIALEILRSCNLPIAAPSANLSGRPSPTLAEHVQIDLEDRIDGGIVWYGNTEKSKLCKYGIESTVVEIIDTDDHSTVQILRPGSITLQQLEDVVGIGKVKVDKNVIQEPTNIQNTFNEIDRILNHAINNIKGDNVILHDNTTNNSLLLQNGNNNNKNIEKEYTNNYSDKIDTKVQIRSPGMKYKHYAPRAPFFLLHCTKETYINTLEKILEMQIIKKINIGQLLNYKQYTIYTDSKQSQLYSNIIIELWDTIDDNDSDTSEIYTRNLYRALRDIDSKNVDLIIAIEPGYDSSHHDIALMNRLCKACGGHVIDLLSK